jgi:hypothetical protein
LLSSAWTPVSPGFFSTGGSRVCFRVGGIEGFHFFRDRIQSSSQFAGILKSQRCDWVTCESSVADDRKQMQNRKCCQEVKDGEDNAGSQRAGELWVAP